LIIFPVNKSRRALKLRAHHRPGQSPEKPSPPQDFSTISESSRPVPVTGRTVGHVDFSSRVFRLKLIRQIIEGKLKTAAAAMVSSGGDDFCASSPAAKTWRPVKIVIANKGQLHPLTKWFRIFTMFIPNREF
jgi:hypothetical protein